MQDALSEVTRSRTRDQVQGQGVPPRAVAGDSDLTGIFTTAYPPISIPTEPKLSKTLVIPTLLMRQLCGKAIKTEIKTRDRISHPQKIQSRAIKNN